MKRITLFIVACFLVTININGYSRLNHNLEKFKIKKDTLTNLQILTDSSIKYAFGYACSIAGMPPKGREAIDNLVELKDFESIKTVLDGQNNVGKIYAIEALLVLASKKIYILTEHDKVKIADIINQDYLIATCEGCLHYAIKTIDLFNEKEYSKLLRNNGIKIKNR